MPGGSTAAELLTFHDLFEPNIVFDDIFLNEVKPEKGIEKIAEHWNNELLHKRFLTAYELIQMTPYA